MVKRRQMVAFVDRYNIGMLLEDDTNEVEKLANNMSYLVLYL